MGIQDTIFDVRADIEENKITAATLANFDRIVTYLGNVEAGRERAEESLAVIIAGEVEKRMLVESRIAARRMAKHGRP